MKETCQVRSYISTIGYQLLLGRSKYQYRLTQLHKQYSYNCHEPVTTTNNLQKVNREDSCVILSQWCDSLKLL